MIAAALLLACLAQESDLHAAARLGDVAELRRLMEAEPEAIDREGPYRGTALHDAVGNSRLDAVTFLIEAGADVNARCGDDGALPLQLARCFEVAKVLLDAGAAIGKDDESRYAGLALSQAVEADDPEWVGLLLDHGADPDARPNPGSESALAQAVRLGRGALVDRLLDAGGSLETTVAGCHLPWLALRGGHPELARRLLAGGAPADLSTLCLLNDAKRVKTWLDEKPSSVNSLGVERRTPLHWAAHSGGGEVVELLVRRGADVDARAPWLEEVWVGGARLVPGSLPGNHGIDPHPDFGSNRGDTPLHDAARMENRAAVQVLLEAGAEVDPFSESGVTPLALAAAAGSIEIVRDLVAAGADPNAYDPPPTGSAGFYRHWQGPAMTPLEGARDAIYWWPSRPWMRLESGQRDDPPLRELVRSSFEISRLLIDAGATVGFLDACFLGDTELVREWLTLDPSLVHQRGNPGGSTAMRWAALMGHVEIGRQLIEAGALSPPTRYESSGMILPHPPEGRSPQGPSPLGFAAGADRTEFVRMLLDEGLDPNDCVQGKPVWFGALPSGSTKPLELLVERGAHLDERARDAGYSSGETALHEAARTGSLIAGLLTYAGL